MFLITGHRGAMARAPENTMRSFQLAVDSGVDEIELDVHLSRDGELVVIHDETLDRTTDGAGAVADQEWAEIARLDAGDGERVPRLAEVLDRFPAMAFQVEVKTPAATAAVLDVLGARRSRPGTLVVTSFHPAALAPAFVPERPWQIGLIGGRGEAWKAAIGAELGVDRFYLHWDVAEPVVAGRPVFVWPCNDAESVQRAIADGYAGTTTDDPVVALAARHAARSTEVAEVRSRDQGIGR